MGHFLLSYENLGDFLKFCGNRDPLFLTFHGPISRGTYFSKQMERPLKFIVASKNTDLDMKKISIKWKKQEICISIDKKF